jgi:hypothetical protein
MRQLLDLARENAALNRELSRVTEEVRAVQRFLAGIPDTTKEHTMPRIVQLAPDGGGRYLAVDWDGELWRARRCVRRTAARNASGGSRSPRSSRGTTEPRLVET